MEKINSLFCNDFCCNNIVHIHVYVFSDSFSHALNGNLHVELLLVDMEWIWFRTVTYLLKVSEYDQELPRSHTVPTHGTVRKSNRTLTVTRHQEDNTIKATGSLIPIKMIGKLEGHKVLDNRTRSKHRTPLTALMGVPLNNESPTTETPP